jgi:CRP/FNR family transcriptional regulator, nitrogen oxide reductase regulator
MPEAHAMSHPNARELLQASAVFAGIPPGDLTALVARSRLDRYAARDHIFREGDPAEWFCLLVEGRVKIVRHARSGKDVVLELLGPGEVFGGVAVIERRPYPASAQAVEAAAVLRIPGEPIRVLSERYPSMIREMALMIGRRLRAAHDTVESLAVDLVEARLARRLVRLAHTDGVRRADGIELPFHLTRQSLADMSGTTVETTIRVVGRWLKEGLLRERGARLIVRDMEALRALAEAEAE